MSKDNPTTPMEAGWWAARVALGEYVKRGGPKPPPEHLVMED
jgi:hypothetical protein